MQNVNNLRAEKLSACTLFCFPLGSETRQVEVLWGMWSGLLRVNGSLSAGHISWMFWEAVMEMGEVRRPTPPPRVFVVSEQRNREREREREILHTYCLHKDRHAFTPRKPFDLGLSSAICRNNSLVIRP